MKYKSKFPIVNALNFTKYTTMKEINEFLIDCKNINLVAARTPDSKRELSFDVLDKEKLAYFTVTVRENNAILKFSDEDYYSIPGTYFNDLFEKCDPNANNNPRLPDIPKNIREIIMFRASDSKTEYEFFTNIYNQIKDNEEYVNGNITLNRSCDRKDGTTNVACYTVTEDSKSNPRLTI